MCVFSSSSDCVIIGLLRLQVAFVSSFTGLSN